MADTNNAILQGKCLISFHILFFFSGGESGGGGIVERGRGGITLVAVTINPC